MKYVRGTRVWRDLRLLSPPARWGLRLRSVRAPDRWPGSAVQARASIHSKRRGSEAKLGRAFSPARQHGIRVMRHALAPLVLAMPVPSSAQPPAAIAYRAPTITLVQPLNGGTVPRDKPIVVFRFARGEVTDPVDVGTFAVVVDGIDRSADFQVTADEAWGPLLKAAAADSVIALGTRAVTARVCSVRGACADAISSVSIIAPPVLVDPQRSEPIQPGKSTRARVIDLVLEALRKLVVP